MNDEKLEKLIHRLLASSVQLTAEVAFLKGLLQTLTEQNQLTVPHDFWEKYEKKVALFVQSRIADDPDLDDTWKDLLSDI